MKINIEFYISRFETSASTNNFDFWNKFPEKRILPVKNTKK